MLLLRRNRDQGVRCRNAVLRLLINDLPSGFCCMAIHTDKHPTLEMLNATLCHMLEMDEKEAWTAYGNDMLKCIDSEEFVSAVSNPKRENIDGESLRLRCRLHKKSETLSG